MGWAPTWRTGLGFACARSDKKIRRRRGTGRIIVPTGKVQFAYVEGLYRVRDVLLERFPNLLMDNGVRIVLGPESARILHLRPVSK